MTRADFLCRSWTEDDEARAKVRHAENLVIIAEHKARVAARLADPGITVEDECTPHDPAFTSDSIADWKRARARESGAPVVHWKVFRPQRGIVIEYRGEAYGDAAGGPADEDHR